MAGEHRSLDRRDTKMGRSKFPGKPSKVLNKRRVNLINCDRPEHNESSLAAESISANYGVFNTTFGDNEQVRKVFAAFFGLFCVLVGNWDTHCIGSSCGLIFIWFVNKLCNFYGELEDCLCSRPCLDPYNLALTHPKSFILAFGRAVYWLLHAGDPCSYVTSPAASK